jgi:hypothetical protein
MSVTSRSLCYGYDRIPPDSVRTEPFRYIVYPKPLTRLLLRGTAIHCLEPWLFAEPPWLPQTRHHILTRKQGFDIIDHMLQRLLDEAEIRRVVDGIESSVNAKNWDRCLTFLCVWKVSATRGACDSGTA